MYMQLSKAIVIYTAFIALLFGGPVSSSAEVDWNHSIEDTIIGYYDEDDGAGLRNRLRLKAVLGLTSHPALSAVVIGDNVSGYLDESAEVYNKMSLNRAYLRYAGVKHLWVVGKQRVPFGTGRVWNPIDLFNPIDSLSIEPEERPGTEAVRYEYALNELSNIDCTLSRDKSSFRIKSFVGAMDIGLVGVLDTDMQRDIIGWEVAGELFATGMEIRSEGGRFHDRQSGETHVEAIIGAEYGFVDSLTLLGEYFYNEDTNHDSLALSAGYQLSMLWNLQVLAITSMSDHSWGLAPGLHYSMADDMTLSFGCFVYNGDDDEEYGGLADRLYFRWFVNI
ncbi:MAG: hypothetical protein OEM02_04425 [Desulfobulbaceae bacterium]|nr:hypothetical protein [Desulfobulbaceae bacterium]